LHIGFALIFLSAGVTSLFEDSFTVTILGGIIALIGFLMMLFGLRQIHQENNKEN